MRKKTFANSATLNYAATARIFCEQFRMPDAQIGFLTSWGLTMGQLLSAIMFIIGAALFACAMRGEYKTKGQIK